jgi:Ni,Fe-hydrogenase III large subunit
MQETWKYTIDGPVIVHARCYRQATVSLGQALLQASSPEALLQCATSLTIAQGVAWAMLTEALLDDPVSEAHHSNRLVLLEMERAIHYVKTLRDMAGMIGLDILSREYARSGRQMAAWLERLVGTKTGKWSVFPGGARVLSAARDADRLEAISGALQQCNHRLLNHPMGVSRFDGLGTIEAENADEMALNGFSARACGRPFDVRKGLPYGFYRQLDVELVLVSGGSVFSRVEVMAKEVESSLATIQAQPLQAAPHPGCLRRPYPGGRLALAAVEAPSGQLLHAAMTGANGQMVWYKISDVLAIHSLAIEKALTGAFFDDRQLIIQSFARHLAVYAP